jgi:hypothetical protein
MKLIWIAYKWRFQLKHFCASPGGLLLANCVVLYVHMSRGNKTSPWPWWWKKHVPSKLRKIWPLQGVAAQNNIIIWSTTAAKTWKILLLSFIYHIKPQYRAFHNVLRDYKNLRVLQENRRTLIHETCTDRRNNNLLKLGVCASRNQVVAH